MAISYNRSRVFFCHFFLVSSRLIEDSVISSLLFSLYTTPLSHLIADFSIPFHFSAADTNCMYNFLVLIALNANSHRLCILFILDSVFTILLLSSKTEYLLIGTSKRRSKVINLSDCESGSSWRERSGDELQPACISSSLYHSQGPISHILTRPTKF